LIIKSYEFLSKTDLYSKYSFFLLYGENIGKVSDISKELIKSFRQNDNTFDTILNFDQIDLDANPNLLNDNLASPDLFGKKKIIIFNLTKTSVFNKIFKYEDYREINSVKVIIKYFELEKRNALRNLFEKKKDLITIPCYQDTLSEKNFILQTVLRKEPIRLTNEQKEFITNIDYKDRNIFKQDLNKITLYHKNNNEISTISLGNILNVKTSYDLNKFAILLLSDESFDIDVEFENISGQGNNSITILNRVSNHVQRLLTTKHGYKKNINIKILIKKLKPPVFFKDEEEFINQVKQWSIKSLENISIKLLDLENSLKTSPLADKTEAKFLFLNLRNYAKNLKI
tara:strand:+ start:399 stop:1427 length:1029 start_codon:yes stop_codon:yes gene_type:complete